MKEKTIQSELIYDGKIIRVEKDAVALENGHQSTREVVFNSGGVCTLALTNNEEVVLVKQFRYPSKEELWEIPGGKADADETYTQTGLRELEEETGYISEEVEYLGYMYPTVAYCSEIIHMVVAKNCTYKQQKLDDGEHVEVHLIPLQEVLRMIETNEIKDGKTIVAILKYIALHKK